MTYCSQILAEKEKEIQQLKERYEARGQTIDELLTKVEAVKKILKKYDFNMAFISQTEALNRLREVLDVLWETTK